LWCAGVMCATKIRRFRFSCLTCRLRRRWYGKYEVPSFYLKYTYKHTGCILEGYMYEALDGKRYCADDGGKIVVYRSYHVLVDSGRLLHFRLCFIRILDQIMGFTRHNKPFIEFAEFLANYPH
jgi:hypothetical protein